ncbi:MAG: ribose 5-phosphate isomerase B [Bullifex sp.]|nr:ribose 5-phosphate isomerase B [Spirochaetales bacterium]MDY3849823.1 ribose 5-phosphate isomerase B [Bullifex sp.]
MAKVVVANDHGAVELAAKLIAHLKERGYEVNYLGTDRNESVDYPDKAKEACIEYLKGGYEFGILLCGTGIGISISANKIRGIRCSLLADCYSAELTKRHNNPNFIAFGGRVDYKDNPVKMLDAFIDATFEGGRHERRIEKMMALEDFIPENN